MRDIKKLLEEIVESMEYSLPEGHSLGDVISNAYWYQDTAVLTPSCDHAQLTYQYGRLLGTADALGESISGLLAAHDIPAARSRRDAPRIDSDAGCTCPGWGHFNIGEAREGIERCDECNKFEDDDEAALAHAKHCKCGSRPGAAIRRCHHCQVELTEEGEVKISNYRAFCGTTCADECASLDGLEIG